MPRKARPLNFFLILDAIEKDMLSTAFVLGREGRIIGASAPADPSEPVTSSRRERTPE